MSDKLIKLSIAISLMLIIIMALIEGFDSNQEIPIEFNKNLTITK